MRQHLGRIKQIVENVKSFLLPTSTEHFIKLESEIIECYSHDIKALERDRDTVKYLVLASRSKRMDVLDKLRSKLPPKAIKDRYGIELAGQNVPNGSVDADVPRSSTLKPDIEPLTGDQAHLLNTYLDNVKTTRLLREHLDEIDKDLEDFRYTVETQAVAELTNYRGINDWGETMRTYVSYYATGLGALSVAGAGLVYSTVFGKADPSVVGLMSLTFPLFTVGFLIPGFVHIGTCWAASVPRSLTFASQRFWTAAMVFALFLASVMVVGAIVIVNITIIKLHVGTSSHGFTLAEIAGIVSLIFSGTVIVVAVMAFFLALYSPKMRTAVKDYHQRVTSKERNALNRYNHV